MRSIDSRCWVPVAVVGLTAFAGTVSACGGPSGAAASHPMVQVKGTVSTPLSVEDLGGTALTELDVYTKPRAADEFFRPNVGDSCEYPEDLSGSEVLIKDADGRTVGLGHVGAGSIIVPSDVRGGHILSVQCRWKFSVPEVRAGGGPYALSIDGGKEMHLTDAELAEPLSLSYG